MAMSHCQVPELHDWSGFGQRRQGWSREIEYEYYDQRPERLITNPSGALLHAVMLDHIAIAEYLGKTHSSTLTDHRVEDRNRRLHLPPSFGASSEVGETCDESSKCQAEASE